MIPSQRRTLRSEISNVNRRRSNTLPLSAESKVKQTWVKCSGLSGAEMIYTPHNSGNKYFVQPCIAQGQRIEWSCHWKPQNEVWVTDAHCKRLRKSVLQRCATRKGCVTCVYLERGIVRVVNAYYWREAGVDRDSRVQHRTHAVRIGNTDTKHLEDSTTTLRCGEGTRHVTAATRDQF